MNYKKVLGFFVLILSLICIKESNMFGRGFGRGRDCNWIGGRGDGRGIREGYGCFQNGSGSQGGTENCPVSENIGRKGRGDGSGRIKGYGRFQDGSGPQGGTDKCPGVKESNK